MEGDDMNNRIMIDPSKYPCVYFGNDIPRKICMPVSPEISGDERVCIVTASIPPGGISEGHIHPDADEYIHFDISGEAEVDDVVYQVPAGGIIHAAKGVRHECRNTDPEHTLTLYCVFVPAFAPYGKYPELIEKTKKHLENNTEIN